MPKGNGRRLIEVYFLKLPNSDHQKYLDVAICKQIKWIGVAYQGSVSNVKTRKLNAMWVSSAYIATRVMRLLLLATKLNKDVSAFNCLLLLSSVTFLTFWWPLMETDDVKAVKRIIQSRWGKYHTVMLELAKIYISPTARLCKVYSHSKTLLITVSTQGLLELSLASISGAAHVVSFAEMDFVRSY